MPNTDKKVAHHQLSTRSIQFTESKLPGCYIVQFPAFDDQRGHFVKTIQRSVFEAHGLEADFRETFYTMSYENVLRGMHFQLPPSDHAKLVYCTAGAIYDVTLDLRQGSPTFGQHEVYELSSRANNAVYLPRGIAHGFFVREGPAVMVYHVTTEHEPALDAGIHWDSFEAAWPTDTPIVSLRDAGFPSFESFGSPFVYGTKTARDTANIALETIKTAAETPKNQHKRFSMDRRKLVGAPKPVDLTPKPVESSQAQQQPPPPIQSEARSVQRARAKPGAPSSARSHHA